MDPLTKDFTINAKLLGALGVVWGGTPSAISPLRSGNGTTVGNEERGALAAAGIFDAGGRILPVIRAALDILGTAQAFTRLYITGGPHAYEYIVYFTSDGKTASLINTGGDCQINSPAIADVYLEMAAQNMGSSVYRYSDLDVTLTQDEVLAFSSLLDLQRKAILRALPDETRVVALPVNLSDINTSLTKNTGNFQWLGNIMMELLSCEEVPASLQIQTALDSLAGKGLVKKKGSSWHLSDSGVFVARRTLIIDTSIVLSAGVLGKNETISIAGFTCLQTGVHDLLLIDASRGSVAMRSVSSAEILDYIHQFLTDPAVYKNLNAATADRRERLCSKCGAVIQPNKKFCPKCGTKVV